MTNPSNKLLRVLPRYLPLILTVVVLAVFSVYFALNTDKFKPLLDVNPLWLLPVAVYYVTSVLVSGLFTKIILQPFKKFISLRESFYVSLISAVGNFFAPVGAGFGFRAVYLKRKHNFSYKDYISMLAGNYVIVFLVNSFIGLVTLYSLRDKSNHQFAVLAVTFAVIFLVSLMLTFVKVSLPKAGLPAPLTWLVKSFHRVTSGWNRIVSDKALMLRLLGLTVANVMLNVLIILTIVKALHFDIGLSVLVLFSVLASLSLFINITPANLGVKEAIFIFSSTVLGFSINQILLISLIDRGVLFLVLLALWLFSARIREKPEMAAIP